jgi:hypothetical protein
METTNLFKLLSWYATEVYNMNQFPDEYNKWLYIMTGISIAITAMGLDLDQQLRYDIDVNGKISGYRNMNRITDEKLFDFDI